jgi:capsule polysaccharide export protein KpsE/RkpR
VETIRNKSQKEKTMFDWTNETNKNMLARILEIGIEATAKELQMQITLGDYELAKTNAENKLKYLQENC